MARQYIRENALGDLAARRRNIVVVSLAICFATALFTAVSFSSKLGPNGFMLISGILPAVALFAFSLSQGHHKWIESERKKESLRRNGRPVLGSAPQRDAFEVALKEARAKGKVMIDRYLVGFELDSGKPLWISDDQLCEHAAVFAKTGVGKTLWLEGLMFQQMARGRASGFTFIDAKRDPGTLADIIMMALMTGRIEDLIVVDPFDPVCAYNFVFTTQRPDVKARKVLRCGLPPTSDQSTTKHYDRLAADAVYRVVRAMESFGLAWSIRDIAVALSAFNFAYPRMRQLLHEQGAKQAMVELGHLASSYRGAKGNLDSARLTDNLRGIASELHSISNSEPGEMFCAPRADLSLTDAILRGKLIYYMLPRLEEAESAARMVKVFREDLEVSIGEITSNRNYRLEDPHMVIIDEGASTFGPTWANLFELARRGRFGLLFGAQSVGGLMDEQAGLSEQFYERVMANVNLKVMMRVGDNRTAMDMSEWIGKITTDKKTVSTGTSTGVNARELTKHIEINKRSADANRDGVTVAEDEEDLVSPEELKHEMSAEKGLAWFDLGDGRLRKGRSIWFESDLPSRWEGREYLCRYEAVEGDEIGLAEWVDEHILTIERAETERQNDGEDIPVYPGGNVTGSSDSSSSSGPGGKEENVEDANKRFQFNLLRGFRGRGRGSVFVVNEPQQAQNSTEQHNSGDASSDPVTPQGGTSNESKQGNGKPAEKSSAQKAGNQPTVNDKIEKDKGGHRPSRLFGPKPGQKQPGRNGSPPHTTKH